MIEAADIAAKLDLSLKSLGADKAALLAAGALAEEIVEVDALITDVTEGRNMIFVRAAQRRERREKAKKHAAILPECVRLREELKVIAHEVEKANESYLAANSSFEYAQGRLNEHLARPIPQGDYPSAKRVREWNSQKSQLQEIVEKKRLELKARNAERMELQGRQLRVTKEFERVSFQERMLRQPEEPPKVVPVLWRVQDGPELTPVRP